MSGVCNGTMSYGFVYVCVPLLLYMANSARRHKPKVKPICHFTIFYLCIFILHNQ